MFNNINFENININKENLDKIITHCLTKKKVIIICGPTCAGKTKIAIILAKIFNTDLISIDSMQVYKYLDIGTDKYNTDKIGIKQFMINLFEPDYNLTVLEFRNICRKIINEEFFKKNKIPILVGGSGLYLRAVVDNLNFTSEEKDSELLINIRKKIKNEINTFGSERIFEKLKLIDPEYANKISKNDIKRIIRALEVYEVTGNTYSSYQKNWHDRKSIYNTIFIGINKPKSILYSCIEKRIENMFKLGLLEEVKNLVDKGYKNCNSLAQAVGYKEVIKYLDGKYSILECKKEIIKNTKKLAKKQMTWFNSDKRIKWFLIGNDDNNFDIILKIISLINDNLNNYNLK